ncbi:MAG: bis(5'-nucleosyl)-tetraphosphatase (symmetrical) YqeK [Chloroflexi bacterium]|nr:bis(5'-nucleosyl)-tetraphosphatase (symmetrical) YqeK [Chloroflexota bacterium]
MSNRYTAEFEDKVSEWALARIPPKRHAHVIGVVEMADKLARLYAPQDVILVRLAGWIHDSAKADSDAELLALAEHYGVDISDFDRRVPMLLHGIVAYHMANDVFALNDDRLATACHYHTTGAPGMSLTDKIVMLADSVETNTRDYPGVEAIRRAALDDLDAAVKLLVQRTLIYLMERDRLIDPCVIAVWNELVSA